MATIRINAAAAEHPHSGVLEKLQHATPLAGRFLLGLIFLLSGFGKIADWSGTAGYMASKSMPFIPFFLVMAILFEVVGSLSVIAGYKARWGALALFLFLIPVSLIFHNFWAYEGMEQKMQMINFLKNAAIEGGLLLIVAYGAGSPSLDARAERKTE